MILVIWKFDSSSMNFNITRLENFHKKMKTWTPGGSTPDKFATYAWSDPAHLMRCIWSELIIALEWNPFWWVTIKGAHWLTFLTETCTMKKWILFNLRCQCWRCVLRLIWPEWEWNPICWVTAEGESVNFFRRRTADHVLALPLVSGRKGEDLSSHLLN